jgi:hypothetical protein
MYLILLETSGNQRYIFSTNKMRENIGASELTYQIGTEVVEKVIEGKSNVKPIITASGKALLTADNEKTARTIVREVTTKALKEMPGLTIHGAICKVEDENSAESFHKAVGEVHKKLEHIRYQMPCNPQRFQRLPFMAECSTSNLPAAEIRKFESEPKPYSIVSITKAENKDKGYERIRQQLSNVKLLPPDKIGQLDWVAVIHADGNGLGEVFLNFYEKCGKPNSKDEYIEKYQKFSNALNECVVAATKAALENFKNSLIENEKEKARWNGKELSVEEIEEIEIPFIPLVLGGDDLTVVCEGRYALKFTKDLLIEFGRQAQENPDIKQIIKLGACAGVTIVKPHYPFHQAYDLAEDLLKSAKKVKNFSPSLSAIDYHVLYDSGGASLDEIRGKTPFLARPYVVTPKDTAENSGQNEEQKLWIQHHHFSELEKRVEAMSAKDDDGKRKLPNSQMHLLRESLYVADETSEIQKEVDSRAKLIAHRYESFRELFAEKDSLFFDENGKKLTHFLDALDVLEFWK